MHCCSIAKRIGLHSSQPFYVFILICGHFSVHGAYLFYLFSLKSSLSCCVVKKQKGCLFLDRFYSYIPNTVQWHTNMIYLKCKQNRKITSIVQTDYCFSSPGLKQNRLDLFIFCISRNYIHYL